MTRHAEIAGGGIGGLSSALMLAQQGWTVRIHEKSPAIREVGAGIYIKNNALEVLESIKLLDRLVPHGFRLERGQYVDPGGAMIQDRPFTGKSRVHVFLRQTLIEILRDAAERAGVEIVTNSTAVAAEPAGELWLEGGRCLRADLVIAADGVRSKIRDSLDLGATYRPLPTIVTRYLIPSREITPEPITREHWSGRYRIGVTPCRHDLTYVYQVCPEFGQIGNGLADRRRFLDARIPEASALARNDRPMRSGSTQLQHRAVSPLAAGTGRHCR